MSDRLNFHLSPPEAIDALRSWLRTQVDRRRLDPRRFEEDAQRRARDTGVHPVDVDRLLGELPLVLPLPPTPSPPVPPANTGEPGASVPAAPSSQPRMSSVPGSPLLLSAPGGVPFEKLAMGGPPGRLVIAGARRSGSIECFRASALARSRIDTQQRSRIELHPCSALAISPDGRSLAVANDQIFVLSIPALLDGSTEGKWSFHQHWTSNNESSQIRGEGSLNPKTFLHSCTDVKNLGPIIDLLFNQDGRFLASMSSATRHIPVWVLPTTPNESWLSGRRNRGLGSLLSDPLEPRFRLGRTLLGVGGEEIRRAFFPDEDHRLVTLDCSGRVRFWDLAQGRELKDLRTRIPDGGMAPMYSSTEFLRGSTDGQAIRFFLGHEQRWAGPLAFSRDGTLVAAFSGINGFTVSGTGPLNSSGPIYPTPRRPTCMAFSSDDSCVACGTDDGALYLWNLRE